MDSGRKLPKRPTEDIFAEAITRVEAGEPVDAVLAAYPAEHQAELRDLLLIIAVAVQIQQAPVPRPALDRRAARKQAFLQTAAELRVERTVTASPATQAIVAAGPTLAERWQALWSAAQATFTVRTMQLAPLIVVLALIVLSSFSLVTFAQDALPGDVVYPVKEWMRYQKLNLSSPAQQPQVLLDNERELRSDIQKVREKAQQEVKTTHDLNSAVIKARSTLIFHGDEGRYFIIGGLQVLKKYQPDANLNQNLRDLTIEGQPAPGKQVILEYQILPVQSGKDGSQIVQGISLRVLETAPVVPTPVPTNTPVPTYTLPPPDLRNCTVKPIFGWLPYQVQPGDTLSVIAQRTNTSVASLLLANCLASDVIPMNGVLLAPVASTATPVVSPTSVATVIPTESSIATVTSVETTTVVATQATATATEVVTGTEPTSEPTLTATTSATSAMTSTTTPAATETALETSVATPEPGMTSSTPVTPTLAATSGATATSIATDFPTVTPTAGTATSTAVATDASSVTPEPAVTSASAGTPTAVNTPGVPEPATQAATVVTLPTFTQTPMPAATQGELPTATATPLPPPTQAPTQVPPTPIPPTQAPLPTTAESTNSPSVKAASKPSPVQRPTLIVSTPTPVSASPIR